MIRRVCHWRLLAAACVLVGLGSLPGGQPLQKSEKHDDPHKDGPPKGELKDEVPYKIERLIENYKKYSGRKNGVLLEVKAEVKAKGDVILVLHWSIDYAGPRFPLHILQPSLGVGWYGQTYVVLFPVDEKGIAHPVGIHPEVPGFLTTNAKEAFLTVNRGEEAKGTIEVPLKKAGTRKIQVGKVSIPPGRLFVQLRHAPYDRGERFNLDAWTGSGSQGTLQTPLIPVPIENSDKN
jgi:hypothetical protein